MCEGQIDVCRYDVSVVGFHRHAISRLAGAEMQSLHFRVRNLLRLMSSYAKRSPAGDGGYKRAFTHLEEAVRQTNLVIRRMRVRRSSGNTAGLHSTQKGVKGKPDDHDETR